jgi:hypothetical protein
MGTPLQLVHRDFSPQNVLIDISVSRGSPTSALPKR